MFYKRYASICERTDSKHFAYFVIFCPPLRLFKFVVSLAASAVITNTRSVYICIWKLGIGCGMDRQCRKCHRNNTPGWWYQPPWIDALSNGNGMDIHRPPVPMGQNWRLGGAGFSCLDSRTRTLKATQVLAYSEVHQIQREKGRDLTWSFDKALIPTNASDRV